MSASGMGGIFIARYCVIAAAALAYSAPANAQTPESEAPGEPASGVAQKIYRGVGGNLLEAVPLDPKDRVQLQRLNAIVSSPLTARSLAAAAGLASPPLMIVGLLWGLWAASKIEAPAAAQTQEQRAAIPEAAELHEKLVLVHAGAHAATTSTESTLAQLVNAGSMAHGARTSVRPVISIDAWFAQAVDARATVSAATLAGVTGAAAAGQPKLSCDACSGSVLYLPAISPAR